MDKQTNQAGAGELSAYRLPVAAGLVIILLAAILRIPGLIEPRFWQDEMISLGVAGGSFFETIIATLRYSSHPPAYYAQLNLWMLGGKNASFILLNSVLWSIGTVAALFYLGRSIVGEKAAALAALFFAIVPQSLYFATNVRMYSMICFFQVIGWWSVERAVRAQEKQRGFGNALLGLSIAQLLIGYAHGIGPIFSASLGLFGLVRLWQEAASRDVLRKYMAVQLTVGAALALVLVNGLMRETQHQPPVDLGGVWEMLTHMLFGPNINATALAPVTFLIYLLVAGAVMWAPRFSVATATLVMLPIGASIITTLFIKPVLSERPLALTLPFIALACATVLVNGHSSAKHMFRKMLVFGSGLIIAASFFVLSVKFVTEYEKPHDFRAAASDLMADIRPGDSVVIIESPTILAGLSWYMLGPESVSSLKIQAPSNERWLALYAKMGNDLVAALGLASEQDTLMWNDVPIIMGQQGVARSLGSNRIWLAYYDPQDITAAVQTLQNNNRKQTVSKSYRGITISRFDAAD